MDELSVNSDGRDGEWARRSIFLLYQAKLSSRFQSLIRWAETKYRMKTLPRYQRWWFRRSYTLMVRTVTSVDGTSIYIEIFGWTFSFRGNFILIFVSVFRVLTTSRMQRWHCHSATNFNHWIKYMQLDATFEATSSQKPFLARLVAWLLTASVIHLQNRTFPTQSFGNKCPLE